LVELLVVIVLIAVLIGLLLPAVQKVRQAVSRIHCQNNLKQLGLATHSYHDENGALPPCSIGLGYATWAVLLLPHIEQRPVFNQWNLSRWYYLQPDAARKVSIPVYYCPSRRPPSGLSTSGDSSVSPPFPETSGGLSDYAGCYGNAIGATNGTIVPALSWFNGKGAGQTLIRWSSRVCLKDITDGTSQTLLFGEKHVRPNSFGRGGEYGLLPWGTGHDEDNSVFNGQHPGTYGRAAGVNFPLASSQTDTYRRNFGSYHPGVCPFVMADGSVRAIATSISTITLSRLAIRNDGQVIGDF
jgi:type II secretory pathway pseudopilin PulG